jgi:hypothetical protein
MYLCSFQVRRHVFELDFPRDVSRVKAENGRNHHFVNLFLINFPDKISKPKINFKMGRHE